MHARHAFAGFLKKMHGAKLLCGELFRTPEIQNPPRRVGVSAVAFLGLTRRTAVRVRLFVSIIVVTVLIDGTTAEKQDHCGQGEHFFHGRHPLLNEG